jgi:hypothetical protein
MSKSGQVPEGDVRLTLNVRRELRSNLKMAAVIAETTMGELVEQLIAEHLRDILRGGLRTAK